MHGTPSFVRCSFGGGRCKHLSTHDWRRAADADEWVGAVPRQRCVAFKSLDVGEGEAGFGCDVGPAAVRDTRWGLPPAPVDAPVAEGAGDQEYAKKASDGETRPSHHGANARTSLAGTSAHRHD